ADGRRAAGGADEHPAKATPQPIASTANAPTVVAPRPRVAASAARSLMPSSRVPCGRGGSLAPHAG
ncbi:MAG: hypothetical protein JWM48_2992, partial [Mycobacterium sp.]|nr:hypothetical protein [Mycobacterium sp.]